ncbi:MAG TPA: PAS domain S-box protein [Candidatus Paceibacterota bacterium]|nr:PAS domain S-box protein [Candidatus Paceibacterota bacterium]HRZ55920.1 PAS domain S-box protein [Candidatus Paceibacterota bacterium]
MRSREYQAYPSNFLIRLTRQQLESVPWGITKVNQKGVFAYANQTMRDIVGVASVKGKSLPAFFRGNDLAIVRRHLKRRMARGVADEYEVGVTRPADGVRVPIRISAMPDIDDRGKVIGAIAIIRDRLIEDVSTNLRHAMEDLRDSHQILEAVAKECGRVAPFDLFTVTLYSIDGGHYRLFFLYPEGGVQLSVRWNTITRFAKQLMSERRALIIPDFKEWLRQSKLRYYRHDADIQRFLKAGFRSILSFQVMSGNRAVATFGLSRKRYKPPFNEQDAHRVDQLRLDGAVRLALHYEKIHELEFSLNLLRKLAAHPTDTRRIADTLVEEIAKHYQWENVSVFQPDDRARRIRLVAQEPRKGSFALPEPYEHTIKQGVTGRVCRTAKALNVPDVRASRFRALYLPGYPKSRSELCIPIMVDDHVHWILNIEDTRRNAFAKEEQVAMENLIKEVSLVLKLASQTRMFSELLKTTTDSVVQTDFQGAIVQTNPATERLLGYSETEMRGTSFADYFKNKSQARRVQEAQYVPNADVRFVRKDGKELSVLLSGTSLPGEIGRKVYVCTEFTAREQRETAEMLRQMYNEIASQIKTPLSLSFTWLGRLRELAISPSAAELVSKMQKQLHKVDLTFERLLFYERRRGITRVERGEFDIPALVEQVRQELPQYEAAQIEVTTEKGVPPARGDLSQIWFCIESLLAHLLRFVPEDGKIAVVIAPRKHQVRVAIRGYEPHASKGTITQYAEARWTIRTIREMAVGEQMIRRFIERDPGGRFYKRRRAGHVTEYVIELPTA